MSISYALLAIIPVVGLAVFCLSHLVASRVVLNRGPYYPLLAGFSIGLAAALAASFALLWSMGTGAADLLAIVGMNGAAYVAFGFGYFNFVNLNIASLRIRMLQELADSGGSMPAIAFASCYNTDSVIALRIQRLVSGGYLVEKEGRYFSGKQSFLIVARIFEFLRWAILGGRAALPSSADGRTGRDADIETCSSEGVP